MIKIIKLSKNISSIAKIYKRKFKKNKMLKTKLKMILIKNSFSKMFTRHITFTTYKNK
jgi:hypothetical protein